VGTIREIATYPTPRKEAAAPWTPAWQTVCPTLQQPCLPSTSLPLPCAPNGARIPSAGARGEEHGKALP